MFIGTLLDEAIDGTLFMATEFITDRLRCVRQDLKIQRLPYIDSIPILEKCIRYHLYIRYLSVEFEDKAFDPVLNTQYLESYFQDLFSYYEDFNRSCNCLCNDQNELCNHCKLAKNIPEFQSYYILLKCDKSQIVESCFYQLYLSEQQGPQCCSEVDGSFTAINIRCYIASAASNPLRQAIKVILNKELHNYYRFFKLCKALTFLQCCCLLDKFDLIRQMFLQQLNAAYSSSFSFPISKVESWLEFDSTQETVTFLENHGQAVDMVKMSVKFSRKNKCDPVVPSIDNSTPLYHKFISLKLGPSMKHSDIINGFL